MIVIRHDHNARIFHHTSHACLPSTEVTMERKERSEGVSEEERGFMNSKQGRSNRRRGGDAERRLAALIRDNWGYEVSRGYAWLKQPDLVGLMSVHIECKYTESFEIRRFMTQAIAASEKYQDGIPAVFHGQARKPWTVTVRYSDWLSMGGEECEHDGRERMNVLAEMDGAIRYTREFDLLTTTIENFMDVYGAWKFPFTEDSDADTEEG